MISQKGETEVVIQNVHRIIEQLLVCIRQTVRVQVAALIPRLR